MFAESVEFGDEALEAPGPSFSSAVVEEYPSPAREAAEASRLFSETVRPSKEEFSTETKRLLGAESPLKKKARV